MPLEMVLDEFITKLRVTGDVLDALVGLKKNAWIRSVFLVGLTRHPTLS
jgi:hypothetical protein